MARQFERLFILGSSGYSLRLTQAYASPSNTISCSPIPIDVANYTRNLIPPHRRPLDADYGRQSVPSPLLNFLSQGPHPTHPHSQPARSRWETTQVRVARL